MVGKLVAAMVRLEAGTLVAIKLVADTLVVIKQAVGILVAIELEVDTLVVTVIKARFSCQIHLQ